MAKSARDKIRLNSSAGTGHFYTTDKNKKNTPAKMENPRDVDHMHAKRSALGLGQDLIRAHHSQITVAVAALRLVFFGL